MMSHRSTCKSPCAPCVPLRQRSKHQNLHVMRVIHPPQSSRRCWRQAATVSAAPTRSTFAWEYDGKDFEIVMSNIGSSGEKVVVLPALSTVSTREEVYGIADELQKDGKYEVVVPDWPGFGDSTRQPMKYTAQLMSTFLSDFLSENFSGPTRVVACGHASSLALQVAAKSPDVVSKLVLVAPTWMAPFKIMGVNPSVRGLFGSALRAPILGDAIFSSFSSEKNLRKQYKTHVFVSEDTITDDLINQKQAVTSEANARFAPSGFITGDLDAAEDRPELLEWLKASKGKVVIVIGNETPKKSGAEMEKMAEVVEPNVIRIPGSLGMFEEFGKEVGQAMIPFLKA